MAFYNQYSFGDKKVQKQFKLLTRLKITQPSIDEIRCLLFGESALASSETILCTDHSVFYLPHLSTGLSRYDYADISAVTIESVRLIPSVCLTISNGSTAKLYVPSEHAEKMAEYIKNKISTQRISSQPYSPADEILKYKNLLDIGAITSEEFEAKKRQLLSL